MVSVAVTGADGRVGEHLLPALEENHRVTPVDRDEVAGWETAIADVTEYDGLVDAPAGHDCIVHLAAESASEADWEAVREPNVEGTWNVYRAAMETDADRVVFASSNHVRHVYNVAASDEPRSQTPPTDARPVSPRAAVRPSGPYGITKVTGEAIGTYHADRFDLAVVNLRIGWVLTRAALEGRQATELAAYARAMWLSPRDCRHGVLRAIAAELPDDRNPLTVNLLSENRERYLSLTETVRYPGYRPRDHRTKRRPRAAPALDGVGIGGRPIRRRNVDPAVATPSPAWASGRLR